MQCDYRCIDLVDGWCLNEAPIDPGPLKWREPAAIVGIIPGSQVAEVARNNRNDTNRQGRKLGGRTGEGSKEVEVWDSGSRSSSIVSSSSQPKPTTNYLIP